MLKAILFTQIYYLFNYLYYGNYFPFRYSQQKTP